MRAADHIVDIGPGAGSFGGRIVAQGSVDDIINVEESVTGGASLSEDSRKTDGTWHLNKKKSLSISLLM